MKVNHMPLNLPLMRNNISRVDLNAVIAHLQQEDPILTQSSNVRALKRNGLLAGCQAQCLCQFWVFGKSADDGSFRLRIQRVEM